MVDLAASAPPPDSVPSQDQAPRNPAPGSDLANDLIPQGELETAPTPPLAGATWALFVAIGLVMMGNGLQGTLLGVRSESEGFSIFVAGIVMAGYFAGFFAGSRYAEHVLGNVGHVRVFAALASTASAAVLLHSIFVNPISWFLMRFVFGLCMAGIYVVAESWLNDLATNKNRGTLLSMYMVVTMLGVSLGQLLLNVADPDGFGLFILASVLVSMSLVPISLSATSSPRMPIFSTLPARDLAKLAPTGLVTSFFGGLAAGTLLAVGVVYAAFAGLETSRITLFVAAPMAGSVITQLPIGRLSDRLPRRGMIFAITLAAAGVAVLLTVVDPGSWLAVGLMAALGGVMFPLYSLGIAYTNDFLPPDKILGASGTLVRINGSGAIIGPVLTGLLMAAIAPVMFFVVIAGAHLAIGAYVLYRMLVIEAIDVDDQRDFVALPVRASAVAASLLPRRRRKDTPEQVRRRDHS